MRINNLNIGDEVCRIPSKCIRLFAGKERTVFEITDVSGGLVKLEPPVGPKNLWSANYFILAPFALIPDLSDSELAALEAEIEGEWNNRVIKKGFGGNYMFKVGDFVKRNPEYCENAFKGLENILFEVCEVNDINIKIKPEFSNVGILCSDWWCASYFILAESSKSYNSFKINLTKLTATQLMELESAIEDEWDERSKKAQVIT